MDRLKTLFHDAAERGIDLDAVLQILGQELHHYARIVAGSREAGEDALQDALVALLQEGANAAAIRDPRAWLFTVLRRKALGYRKSEPTSLAKEFSASVDADPNSRLLLEESLQRLAALDQEIILLHLWEGLTFEGVADVLAMPRNTVLSRYSRAIQQLRQYFGVPNPADPAKKRQEVRC